LGDLAGIDILNPLSTDWKILDANTSAPVIVPDTVPRFEYRGEARVADYPIEQGAFASYNKVQVPFDIRMTMVCSGLNLVQKGAQALTNAIGLPNGQSLMQRPDFLDTLEYMRLTTDLFVIVTPDKTYSNVSLEHFDYRREATNGAVMLIVEAWFREIRVTGQATYTKDTASPSGADPVGLGTVHPGDTVTVSFPDAGGIQ
jgi:hypothetical protein